MAGEQRDLLQGIVEADETCVGGKPQFLHSVSRYVPAANHAAHEITNATRSIHEFNLQGYEVE